MRVPRYIFVRVTVTLSSVHFLSNFCNPTCQAAAFFWKPLRSVKPCERAKSFGAQTTRRAKRSGEVRSGRTTTSALVTPGSPPAARLHAASADPTQTTAHGWTGNTRRTAPPQKNSPADRYPERGRRAEKGWAVSRRPDRVRRSLRSPRWSLETVPTGPRRELRPGAGPAETASGVGRAATPPNRCSDPGSNPEARRKRHSCWRSLSRPPGPV